MYELMLKVFRALTKMEAAEGTTEWTSRHEVFLIVWRACGDYGRDKHLSLPDGAARRRQFDLYLRNQSWGLLDDLMRASWKSFRSHTEKRAA